MSDPSIWLMYAGVLVFLVLACLTVWVVIKLRDDRNGQPEYDDELFDLSPRRAGLGQVTTVRLADGREALMVQQAGTNGMAVASLVLSLLGISLLGLIFGFVALGQIEKNPGQQGRGMAIAGIVLSVLWLAVVGILYALVFYAAKSGT